MAHLFRYLSSCFVFAVLLTGNGFVVGQNAPSLDDNQTIVLFDGTSLDHWRGYHHEEIGDGWKIEDDVLKFDGSKSGDIITKRKFGNFEFTFEWAVTEGANSGVMYKVSTGDNASYFTGPEYQILDDANHHDGKNPLTSAGSLYGLYSPGDARSRPVGEWNTGKIVINGNKVQHWLNGKLAVEAEIGSDEWNEKVANSKFREWKKFAVNESGHLCLQDHGNEAWFRNIKITPIVGDK